MKKLTSLEASFYDALFESIYALEGELTRWLKRVFSFDDIVAFEVVTCVLIKAFRNRRRFDPSRATLRTWVYTIAKRTAIDRWRKRKRFPTRMVWVVLPEGLDEVCPDEKERPRDARIQQVELHRVLVGLTDRLPARQRDVIWAFHEENLSYVAIAQKMNLSERQVAYAYKAGMDSLRRMVQP